MSDTYGADPNAPLVPANVPSPDVNAPAQTGGLADQWRGWMADPHNRAAMMQFGIALSQPIGAGQNALGQIGSAFGQAGEASDRITAEQRAEEEALSKQDLRKAQAEGQEAKASSAGDRALYQQNLLELRRQGLDFADQARVARAYRDYQELVRKQNKDIDAANLIKSPKERKPSVPEMSLEEFIPRYRGAGASGNIAPTAATGAAPVSVSTPADVSKLSSGTRYVTPDGRTGTAP